MAEIAYEEQRPALVAAAGQFQAVGKHIRECLRKIEDLRRRGEASQFAAEIAGLIGFADNLQQVTSASLFSGVAIVPAPPADEVMVVTVTDVDEGTTRKSKKES